MKVIKIGAEWCPGCIIMKPRWAEIEAENPWLDSQYLDFDEDSEQVAKYEVGDKIPVFIFLDKKDEEFLRLTGQVDKKKLVEILQENKER